MVVGVKKLMDYKKLTLELSGNRISTINFRKAIENFFYFIDDVSSQMTEKRRPFRWYVALESGSLLIHVIPEPRVEDISRTTNIIDQIEMGIRMIPKGERPNFYTDEALTNLREMAIAINPQKTGIEGINVYTNGNKNELTTAIISKIDTMLQIRREEYASFEGKLLLISAREGYHFNLYEFISDNPIKCIFKEDMIKEVLSAFGKRVYVFGLVKYKKGNIPSSIQVEKFRILKEQKELPTANDVLGILKGIR